MIKFYQVLTLKLHSYIILYGCRQAILQKLSSEEMFSSTGRGVVHNTNSIVEFAIRNFDKSNTRSQGPLSKQDSTWIT